MSGLEKLSLLQYKQKVGAKLKESKKFSRKDWDRDSSSCSSSSSSRSYSEDSYIANWENFICNDGSLFYAEYVDHNAHKNAGSRDSRTSQHRVEKRHRNKLSKLIRKDDKKDNTSETKSDDLGSSLGKINEVQIHIRHENLVKREKNITTESVLGICTSIHSDGKRLILSGFAKNSELSTNKSIQVGDFLKSINNIEVTKQNVYAVLASLLKAGNIILKFESYQNTSETEEKPNVTSQQITSFNDFAEQCGALLSLNDDILSQSTASPFSLILLTSDFSNADIEANDVLFCYPPKESNILFPVRGTFLTLSSLLKAELNSEPVSSTVIRNGHLYNVIYLLYDKVLILFSISSNFSSLKETQLRANMFMQYLQFRYMTLDIPLQDTVESQIMEVCKVVECRIMRNQGFPQFEKLFQESLLITVPREAQLRIFDALSEMEAMDYRDWNEEPLNSHREFFIFGSALFFKSFLLVSHLPVAQLTGIEAFLRKRGVFDFIEVQNVRDLVIWEEIPMMTSESRFFLAVASRNQLLLAVILQLFTPGKAVETEASEKRVVGPSLFYIEEIQETLDHLRHGGIVALARTWVCANKRPEIVKNPLDSKVVHKRHEFISVLKHRSLSSDDVRANSSMGGSSVHSLTHSEDSNQKPNEDDSDSDWNHCPESHKGSSGFDMSEVKDSLVKEICDVLPTRITAGKENVLFHYVYLDPGTGIILAPPEGNTSVVLSAFRSACQQIHSVLQSTKKCRRQAHLNSGNTANYNYLTSIKEHGVLLSLSDNSGNESTFWAIGRLFTGPTRELFVCHQTDIPQSMVEIAFRLSFYNFC